MPLPVVTSRSNARVKQLRAAFQSNARLSQGLIAIEGDHLLEEAFLSGQAIKTVFLSERRDPPSYLPPSVERLTLAPAIFASLTGTRSPQGIAALLVPPVTTLAAILDNPTNPLLVLAVGLQDPGNLGTLIRSAEAFGATALLTSPGTVSPWNGKTLRASAGSVFRLPLAQITLEDLPRLANLQLLAAIPTHAVPITQVNLTRPTALLIGNEGAGLPEDWLTRATQRITIPTPGPVESLNAAIAASILLYEASRQRTQI